MNEKKATEQDKSGSPKKASKEFQEKMRLMRVERMNRLHQERLSQQNPKKD